MSKEHDFPLKRQFQPRSSLSILEYQYSAGFDSSAQPEGDKVMTGFNRRGIVVARVRATRYMGAQT